MIVILLVFITVGCSTAQPEATQTPTLEPSSEVTQTLPQPGIRTTPVPDPSQSASDFLDAWKVDDYESMYAMLTPLSKDAITFESFEGRMRKILTEAAVGETDYEIISDLVKNRESAEVSYRTILNSVLVGEIRRETTMGLSLVDNQWMVQWSDDLILPELAGGNYLWMQRQIPSRANIYDREGNILAAFAEAASVGLIPGQIDPDTEDSVLNNASWLTGIPANRIAQLYADYPPGAEWYLPLGEVILERAEERFDIGAGYNFNGLLMYPFQSRFYFDSGVAPHAVGYVSLIQESEAETFLRRGYSIDEKVGRMGIERWAEPYLGGIRGGTLYVVGPDDQIVTQLADVPAQPAQAVYTTIDKELQETAQVALQKFRGAVVVLERETGRVLAMASSPWYDPNAFEPMNYNSQPWLEEIYSGGGTPLTNRATQGQYPLGSVFKIITMAAALESGVYTPDTIYQCGYHFDELQGIRLNDWTYEHYLEDLESGASSLTQPSGELTLEEGLMRSCNPYFWHIGLDLYNQGLTTAVSDMARGFGLAQETGIVGVEEETGQIPDPASPLDATNGAIGQGGTLVTPIQVAQFVAALGNDGVVYRPQLIEQIVPPTGEPIYQFQPEQVGSLPVSTETLESIQRAMISVVENPRGTAQFILGGLSRNYYPMAGKTGTAESGSGEPHAWFTGYTMDNNPNYPDIAIVVVAENAGEGSEIAAPIFRAMIQQYFTGSRTALPWESQIGVLDVEEEEEEETGEETPTEEDGQDE